MKLQTDLRLTRSACSSCGSTTADQAVTEPELVTLSAYECPTCLVQGRDPEQPPHCWCCGRPVKASARVRVTAHEGGPWRVPDAAID